MNHHRMRWTLVALLLPATSPNQFAAAEPPLLDEFRASVRQWTAGAGSVIITTELPEESDLGDRRTAGFDPATGAWFGASQLWVSGQTPDGVVYFGSPDGVAPMDDQTLRLPAHAQGVVPMALPLQLLKTTEGLVDLTKDAHSNWVIEYLAPAPTGIEQPHARMVVSPEGRPLRYEMDARPWAGIEAIAYDYEFEPDSRDPLLIPVDRSPNPHVPPYKLVKVEYYPTSRPELFTTEVVLALAVDNRMRSQMRFNALAARLSDSRHGGSGTETEPYMDNRLSRASWPLIVTGIVVVALGLLALFRARSGK
jgi:hypothetical protein